MTSGITAVHPFGLPVQAAGSPNKNASSPKQNTISISSGSSDTVSLSGANKDGKGVRFSGYRDGDDYVHNDGRRERGVYRNTSNRNARRDPQKPPSSRPEKSKASSSKTNWVEDLLGIGKAATKSVVTSEAQKEIRKAVQRAAPENRHTHSLKKSYVPMTPGEDPPADVRYPGNADKQRKYDDDTYSPQTIRGVHGDHSNLWLSGFETHSDSSNDDGYSRHDTTHYGPDGVPTGVTESDRKKFDKRRLR